MAREDLKSSPLLYFHEIKTDDDLANARTFVKMHAADIGFSTLNQTKIVTAASELGRNTIEHGLGGTLTVERLFDGIRYGIKLIFEDKGPGISNMELALVDGYTSKKGLGLGLTGSQRLMDEFEITSAPGTGTCVRVVKWM